ncbi:MAG TPA: protein-export chaperone SecB [Rhodospirillaceae bacterium]|nr:protein-export chaperone SecB [Rhodospirillaceae bacterium]
MTDSKDDEQALALQVNAQYVKDLSFEVPGAPGIYLELNQQGGPELSVRVDLAAQPVDENGHFEVVLQLVVEAKLRDKIVFLADLSYAGLFTLNLPEEHIQPVLMIECPRLLFPFARAIIADMTRDGGFPPVLLQPIDFMALYRSRVGELAQEEPKGNA